MSAPASVIALVDRFHADLAHYRAPQYKETEARQEFIDPLFKALGWDIGNERGAAAAFREVQLEYSMKIGASTKAPDYLFRFTSGPKFFVEAKKPSVNLRESFDPAFQLRRYAWTAKLPLSVLTDFDEWAIYDTRVEPSRDDAPSVARYLYLPYTQYVEQWDTIANLFSRESVLAGSLERFAQEQKAPRGALPVDRALLADIDNWRGLLAKNIFLWDQTLSVRDLNYAVQMTLDRIIFLRMCEDRGIEPYGKLEELIKGGDVYTRLRNLFRAADDRYNSGLFHFTHEKVREGHDTLTPTLHIDDEPLQKIIRGLYYPYSPYEFSVMPVEVLGNVYEQFLGSVITIGAERTVEVEQKPEVRKAGGVYYTPQYIVDYIVTHTVGTLVKDKTPTQVEQMRVLDPACGSGSFLIGAFQFLIDWHLAQYVADGPQKYKKQIYQLPDGAYRLTPTERKRILLNNIYGVDLDAQAVEVTKLSLCLKMLEGETSQTIAHQQSFLQQRVLPDLSANIKCGNALIGPDFYATPGAADLGADDLYRINAFDWQTEFPAAMRAGGFDAVIGNPPYVDVKILGGHVKQLLSQRYKTATRRFDLYIPFVEKAFEILQSNGLLSYIMPSMFIRRDYGRDLRGFIAKNGSMETIVDFGTNQVFGNAMNYVAVFIIRKSNQIVNTSVIKYERDDIKATEIFLPLTGGELTGVKKFSLSGQHFCTSDEWYLTEQNEAQISQRLSREFPALETMLVHASEGIHSGKDEVFFVSTERVESLGLESPPVFPLAKGKDIHRYQTIHPQILKHRVIYPYHLSSGDVIGGEELQELAPNTWSYLESSRPLLGGRPYFERSSKVWYELWCQRVPQLYTSPKIVGPEIANRGEFTLCKDQLFVNNKIKVVIPRHDIGESLEYLLGVLNSLLLVYIHRLIAPPKGSGFFEVKTGIMGKLPIRRINFTDPADKSRHDQIVHLVEKMLELNKNLPTAQNAHDKTFIQRQITATDAQIDTLVYALYGLSAAEIAIVEATTKR